jgi:AcrR family transcriptional regulator
MRNCELLWGGDGRSLGAMAAVVRKPVRRPRPRGEAFVRAVLEAALAQLAEVGFERLSIPEVAAQAGVNKTSIYRRWPGKSELVRDALAAAMSHADDVPDTGELRGDLLGLARAVADFAHSPVGTAVVRILLAEGGNPEVRALASAAYREADPRGPHAALLRAAARGELAEAVDPSLVLFTIAGAVVHRVFIEQGRATQPFVERVVDLVLYGAAKKRRPAPR